MSKAVEIAIENYQDVDMSAALEGRILSRRVKMVKTLAENIRNAKKMRRTMNQMGLSTRPVDNYIRMCVEDYNHSSQVMMHIRARYSSLCLQKRKETVILRALGVDPKDI